MPVRRRRTVTRRRNPALAEVRAAAVSLRGQALALHEMAHAALMEADHAGASKAAKALTSIADAVLSLDKAQLALK